MSKNAKIGIVTHYSSNNFGAVLQSKALADAIVNLFPEADCKVLDYEHEKRLKPPTLKTVYKNKKGIGILGIMKGIFHAVIFYFNRIKSANKTPTQNFINTHVRLDEHVSLDSEGKLNFSNEQSPYSILICGSDQIWAHWCMAPHFLLKSAQSSETKRLAYAPSFGNIEKLSPNQLSTLSETLKGFSGISCRETDGAELIRKLTGSPCPVLPDPTLLHEKEYWLKLARKPKNFPYKEREFVFTYRISFTPHIAKTAAQVAKKLKLPLVTCELVPPHSFYSNMGPQEFLWCVAHAAHVITPSFHGTVFSLIMGTPFHTITSSAPQKRMTTLFANVGLENRLVGSIEEMDLITPQYPVEQVSSRLSQLRQTGINWLSENLHPTQAS